MYVHVTINKLFTVCDWSRFNNQIVQVNLNLFSRIAWTSETFSNHESQNHIIMTESFTHIIFQLIFFYFASYIH